MDAASVKVGPRVALEVQTIVERTKDSRCWGCPWCQLKGRQLAARGVSVLGLDLPRAFPVWMLPRKRMPDAKSTRKSSLDRSAKRDDSLWGAASSRSQSGAGGIVIVGRAGPGGGWGWNLSVKIQLDANT